MPVPGSSNSAFVQFWCVLEQNSHFSCGTPSVLIVTAGVICGVHFDALETRKRKGNIVYSSSKCFGTLMSRRKNMVVEVCV